MASAAPTEVVWLQFITPTGPQRPSDGFARLANQSFSGVAGAGGDLVTAVLSSSAISDAQGWFNVMAYTGSPLEGPIILG